MHNSRLTWKAAAAVAAALVVPLAVAAPAAAQQATTVQLDPLNNSGASGTARISLDNAANTLTVDIDANGLVPNLPHAQHVHIGGQNICPPPSAAGDDNIISTPEGQPFYGDIDISLTTMGDFGPGSALALDRFPVASAEGRISYERTFDLTEVQGDLMLDEIVIVQHGIDTISPNGEYGPPPPNSPLDPNLPLEGTAPADCGAVILAAGGQVGQQPAGGQVGQQPAGGVETGGGSTAGIENEVLLALGALSLLGAVAIAIGRHTASDSA